MPLPHLPRGVLARRRDSDVDTAGADSSDLAWRETISALAENRLSLLVQPIGALSGGGYVGLETLIGHPGEGPARPGAEVLAPEHDGASDGPPPVVGLNAWLVREAVSALARWSADLGAEPAAVFVTVAVAERFVADDDFLTVVKDAVRASGIRPGNLMLTVRGTPGFEPLWSKLQRLRSHGVRVALDDVASHDGAADLLRRFSFDVVRIAAPAAPFVPDADADADGGELRATIKLAHNLGCQVVATGVDHPEQVELLRRLGADHALGSRLGAPWPATTGPVVPPSPGGALERRPVA